MCRVCGLSRPAEFTWLEDKRQHAMSNWSYILHMDMQPSVWCSEQVDENRGLLHLQHFWGAEVLMSLEKLLLFDKLVLLRRTCCGCTRVTLCPVFLFIGD